MRLLTQENDQICKFSIETVAQMGYFLKIHDLLALTCTDVGHKVEYNLRDLWGVMKIYPGCLDL